MLSITLLLSAVASVQAFSESSLNKKTDVLDLVSDLIPNIPQHGLAHHARTPLAISPDGKTLYVAYQEGSRYIPGSQMKLHVQKLSPDTFEADGDACTIDGAQEASGLVALNDGGFTVLTAMNFTDTDPDEHDIPVVARYKDCKATWTRKVGGKTVPMLKDGSSGQFVWYNTPHLDGDLAFASDNSTYAAFFRVSFYGLWQGHGGDMVVYLDDSQDQGQVIPNWSIKDIITEPISSTETDFSVIQHCGHNFGLGIAPSNDFPFAAICTSDHSALELTTDINVSGGDKFQIGKAAVADMFGGEALGGTQGSYNVITPSGQASYLVSWVTRPSLPDNYQAADACNPPAGQCITGWCGDGFTQCDDPVESRTVQVAQLKDKWTVNNETTGLTEFKDTTDASNPHIVSFDENSALVSWEEEEVQNCKVLSGCESRSYKGTWFQKVDATGKPQGDAFTSTDVFVSGDIVKVEDNLCWPYLNTKWDTSKDALSKFPSEDGAGSDFPTVKKLSFACVSSQ